MNINLRNNIDDEEFDLEFDSNEELDEQDELDSFSNNEDEETK